MSTDAIVFPLLFLLFFGTIGFWIFTRFRRSQSLIQARMELQSRVLERFESPGEFTAFLDTVGGRRFLAGLSDERGWRPMRRILTAIQWGLVLVFFGVGFLVMNINLEEDEIIAFGVLWIALGCGFLASATAAYLLSKAWGLLGRNGHDELRTLADDVEA